MLRETGSLPSIFSRYDRSSQHEEAVDENINDSPDVSTRRPSRRLGVSQSMVWSTLRFNKQHPNYKQPV